MTSTLIHIRSYTIIYIHTWRRVHIYTWFGKNITLPSQIHVYPWHELPDQFLKGRIFPLS